MKFNERSKFEVMNHRYFIFNVSCVYFIEQIALKNRLLKLVQFSLKNLDFPFIFSLKKVAWEASKIYDLNHVVMNSISENDFVLTNGLLSVSNALSKIMQDL